jgi:hypothetical protein
LESRLSGAPDRNIVVHGVGNDQLTDDLAQELQLVRSGE